MQIYQSDVFASEFAGTPRTSTSVTSQHPERRDTSDFSVTVIQI